MIALILDSETTGLMSSHLKPLDLQPEIIELHMALCDIDKKETIEEQSYLCFPRRLDTIAAKEAQRVHKITKETLIKENAQPFSKYAKEIIHKIETAPAVIAHNATYDCEVLDFEAERLGLRIKWPRAICTIEQTMHLAGRRLALQKLHETLFSEKFKEAHRAGPDTQALIRCCYKLREDGLL